jgi:uncharacterized protein (TIGR03067 family)
MRNFKLRGFAFLSLVLVCGQASAVDDPTAKATAEDLKKLAGTWTVVSAEIFGKEAAEAGQKIVVSGTKLKWFHSDKDEAKFVELEFKLDPMKSPKQIDVKQATLTLKGIYSLDGNKLRLCMSDDERPMEFSTERKPYLIVRFKRP